METFSFSELKIEKLIFILQSQTKILCISVFNVAGGLASCLTFRPFLTLDLYQQKNVYSPKLVVRNYVTPGSFSLKDCWLTEKHENEDGILQWPSTDYVDVANFNGLTQTSFLKRFQSDYKQGKCYR